MRDVVELEALPDTYAALKNLKPLESLSVTYVALT